MSTDPSAVDRCPTCGHPPTWEEIAARHDEVLVAVARERDEARAELDMWRRAEAAAEAAVAGGDSDTPSVPLRASVSDEQPVVVVADPDTAQTGTGALDAAIEAAAEAMYDERRRSAGLYHDRWATGNRVHRRNWLNQAELAVHAAAPLIPVSEQQRADIERDALLRAARDIEALNGRGIVMSQWGTLRWLRARAASVGTEEGNRAS